MAVHYDFDRMKFNYEQTWIALHQSNQQALRNSFDWGATPQGHAFWQNKGSTKEAKDAMECMLMLHKLLRERLNV